MPHNPAKLEVIARADAVVVEVHQLAERGKRTLSDLSPGIRNQLLRAATSISLNLSEACGYHAPTKSAALLDVAIGSCNEVERLLILLQKLKAFDQSIDGLAQDVARVRRMTYGLRKHILNSHVPGTGAQQAPADGTPTPTSDQHPDSHRP